MKEFFDMESFVFHLIDEFKVFLSPEQWGGSSALMNFSKNEIFVLLFVSRQKSANISEIAEYINAPLNTVTGIVGRLEKQKLIERVRSDNDRRVVNIVLTEEGMDFMERELSVLGGYVKQLYVQLTDEEKAAAMSIFTKFVKTFRGTIGSKGEMVGEDKRIKRITIE